MKDGKDENNNKAIKTLLVKTAFETLTKGSPKRQKRELKLFEKYIPFGCNYTWSSKIVDGEFVSTYFLTVDGLKFKSLELFHIFLSNKAQSSVAYTTVGFNISVYVLLLHFFRHKLLVSQEFLNSLSDALAHGK